MWEKSTVNWLMVVHCPQACRPQAGRLEPEGWWCWLPVSSSPDHQKNAMSGSCPFWTITIKLLTTPSRSGHSFEGISLLWPPLPDQAINFFFTLPKTLSLKFNLVSEYRGHIWLQYDYCTSIAKTSWGGFVKYLVNGQYALNSSVPCHSYGNDYSLGCREALGRSSFIPRPHWF